MFSFAENKTRQLELSRNIYECALMMVEVNIPAVKAFEISLRIEESKRKKLELSRHIYECAMMMEEAGMPTVKAYEISLRINKGVTEN